LYGYPVVFSQHLASTAAGTTGTALCALANLKTGTVFGDRRSLQVSISEHYLFNTDELAFKAVERFGFTCHDPGTASAAGSVIVLKRLT
jgi:HK97 family phage major capsid protein